MSDDEVMNIDSMPGMNAYSGADLARPLSVLVLEPNDEAARVCIESFSRRGWLVNQAHTFKEALGFVQDRSYEVAIIEVMLPDVVGTDAWNSIRKLSPNTIGIITTSSPSLRASINPVEPGVISFLLKPFDVDVVADLITQALENQQKVFKDQRLEQQLSGLSALLAGISRAPASKIITTALAYFPSILRADSVIVYTLNEDRSLSMQWQEDRTPAELEWIRSRSEFIQGIVVQAIDSRKPVVVGVPQETEQRQALRAPFDVELGTIVIMPLSGANQTYGALAVLDKNDSEYSLSAAEVELVELVAQSIGLALDHAQPALPAAPEGMLGELGGRLTWAYLDRYLEMEVARSNRYKRPFSFLLIDIANLRKYDELKGNNSRGEILESVLALARRQLRGSDVIGCLPNQEIAILLPETDDSNARTVAQRLTQAIETRLSGEIEGLRPVLKTQIVQPSQGVTSLEDLLKPTKIRPRRHGNRAQPKRGLN